MIIPFNITKRNFKFIYCFMCMSVFVCLCECAFEDQKKALDALGLELQMVVSHHVGTCNQTHVLCNSNKCSCGAIFPVLELILII